VGKSTLSNALVANCPGPTAANFPRYCTIEPERGQAWLFQNPRLKLLSVCQSKEDHSTRWSSLTSPGWSEGGEARGRAGTTNSSPHPRSDAIVHWCGCFAMTT